MKHNLLSSQEIKPLAGSLFLLYGRTYGGIGQQYSNDIELVSEQFLWAIELENNNPIAFSAFKETICGYKMVVSAHNGSLRGKKIIMQHLTQLNVSGFFAELSMAIETVANRLDVKKVPVTLSEPVIYKISNKRINPIDEFSYLRYVTKLGMKRKTMFGNPVL